MMELELDGTTSYQDWVSLGGKFPPPLGLVPLGCVPLFAMRLVFLCCPKRKRRRKRTKKNRKKKKTWLK
jgi:hypothetical protein